MQYTIETYLYSHCDIYTKYMKHASETAETFGTYICNIRLKQMKHVEHTYVCRHCNICNIISFCNIKMKHADETREIYV